MYLNQAPGRRRHCLALLASASASAGAGAVCHAGAVAPVTVLVLVPPPWLLPPLPPPQVPVLMLVMCHTTRQCPPAPQNLKPSPSLPRHSPLPLPSQQPSQTNSASGRMFWERGVHHHWSLCIIIGHCASSLVIVHHLSLCSIICHCASQLAFGNRVQTMGTCLP